MSSYMDSSTTESTVSTTSDMSMTSSMDQQAPRTPLDALLRISPNIINMFGCLLEFYIKREHTITPERQPIEHFSLLQTVHAASELLFVLQKGMITHKDIHDQTSNLLKLQEMLTKLSPESVAVYSNAVKRLIIISTEMTEGLERVSGAPVTNWNKVGALIDARTAQSKTADQRNFRDFIPSISSIQEVQLLGAGGFGAVYKAIFTPAQLVMSAKIIPSDRFKHWIQATTDKGVASVVNSNFLVRYYSCFAAENAFVTLMEYIPGIDLSELVSKIGFVSRHIAQLITVQIYLGVEHLHLRGFIHRDIKIQNVLIKPGGRLKVIDFDTNKCCLGHFVKYPLLAFFRRTAHDFNDKESAGTILYMAPEIIVKRPYGRSVDFWALGVTCYKLTTGKLPFRGRSQEEVQMQILNQKVEWPMEGTTATPECKDFVSKTLIKNPLMRLGSRIYLDIRQHPFFKEVDTKTIENSQQLVEIPNLPSSTNTNGPPSSEVSAGSIKRAKLRIADLIDLKKDNHVPMLSFVSPSMKKLLTRIWKSGKPTVVSPEEMVLTLEKSEEMHYITIKPVETEIVIPPRTLEAANVTVHSNSGGSFNSLDDIGFKLLSVYNNKNDSYLLVNEINPHSPASESSLRIGDIIIGVNNQLIGKMNYKQSIKHICNGANRLTLHIALDNIYRYIGDDNSIGNFLKQATILDLTIVIVISNGCCSVGNNHENIIIDSIAYNEPNKFHHTIRYVSHNVKIVHPLNGKLLTGDIVTHLNGVKVVEWNKQRLVASMNPEGFEVTILCSSPLRMVLEEKAVLRGNQPSTNQRSASKPQKRM